MTSGSFNVILYTLYFPAIILSRHLVTWSINAFSKSPDLGIGFVLIQAETVWQRTLDSVDLSFTNSSQTFLEKQNVNLSCLTSWGSINRCYRMEMYYYLLTLTFFRLPVGNLSPLYLPTQIYLFSAYQIHLLFAVCSKQTQAKIYFNLYLDIFALN